MVVSLVDPKPGEMIVDCCAAPGGKTLFMGSRLQGRGIFHVHLLYSWSVFPWQDTKFKGNCITCHFRAGAIYAVDINRGRLRILEEAAKLHGVDDVITAIHSDLRRFAVSSHSYGKCHYVVHLSLMNACGYSRRKLMWDLTRFFLMLHVLGLVSSPRFFLTMYICSVIFQYVR